jgi:hypothetical protein
LTVLNNVAYSEPETPPERIDDETNDNDGIDRGLVWFELSIPVSAAAHKCLRQVNEFQKKRKASALLGVVNCAGPRSYRTMRNTASDSAADIRGAKLSNSDRPRRWRCWYEGTISHGLIPHCNLSGTQYGYPSADSLSAKNWLTPLSCAVHTNATQLSHRSPRAC